MSRVLVIGVGLAAGIYIGRQCYAAAHPAPVSSFTSPSDAEMSFLGKMLFFPFFL